MKVPMSRKRGETWGTLKFLLAADNFLYDLGKDLWDDQFGGCAGRG